MKKKKQLKNFVICMLCVICTLITFTPINTNAATKTTLSSTKITLKFGNTKVLKLNNAKGKVTWKCSNSKIVSIKKKDAASITLTPKKQGNVTIIATNNKKTYTCKVNVPKMKYDKWNDEKVMLGYINTVTISNVHSPIQWSIDDNKIASIKAKGKNNYKLDITALTHGTTTIYGILDGTTYKIKVIVPEVKLDVAKVKRDMSKYYMDNYFGPMNYDIVTYYDENGNDITNTFDLIHYYYYNGTAYQEGHTNFDLPKDIVVRSCRPIMYGKFIGTDIDFGDCEWTSSNPEKVTISKSDGTFFHEVPSSGTITFSTKLGNETFSFDLEYDICELPKNY